ncbi:divergent polysaccharide deacetylase family protein [Alteromonas sp. ASW11-130]|uniref:divergent polysaccharide deacetylase family protein n=1 Tax=Alteromonas sp. ASW11-130 TaxID=3015775 RepID=UPI002241E8B1|nr:divergent polysaccharide deacetylase family protein [Alteromonas sp. ASW11-130]MCW8090886.1 divergent polysaccharide deacetylase family protein [Alteromonas sp. ASW11-130]
MAWLLFLLSPFAFSAPQIMLIMDDIGYRHTDRAALALPKEVVFSILPATPLAQELAYEANAQGRDVMLHLPMEALNGKALGPQGLQAGMFPSAISETFSVAIDSVPFAIGVNNHMGSRLTQEAAPMLALMQEIKARDLFFIDSRTTVNSVAEQIATDIGLPVVSRNVFIDHTLTVESMKQALERLMTLAKQKGFAVGIAHPHPLTVSFLLDALPLLEKENIRLVSANQYFKPATEMLAIESSAPETNSAPQ